MTIPQINELVKIKGEGARENSNHSKTNQGAQINHVSFKKIYTLTQLQEYLNPAHL